MKKMTALILAFILFVLGIVPTFVTGVNAATFRDGESYFAINRYGVNLRDDDGNLVAYIPAGNTMYVYHVYDKDESRSVVEWEAKIGNVLNGGLKKFLPHKANPFKATNIYGVNLRDDDGNLVAYIPAGEQLDVRGVYTKDSSRSVVVWNGKRGHILNGGLVEDTSNEEVPSQESEKPPDEEPPEESMGPEAPPEETPIEPEQETENSYSGPSYEAITTGNLVIRDDDYNYLGCVPKGTRVLVLEMSRKYPERARIEWEGMEGTVIVSHLKKVESPEETPEEPQPDEEVSYSGSSYEAITAGDLVIRDDDYNYLGLVPKGTRLPVFGMSNKYPERARIEWQGIEGTVIVSHLIPCTGDGYWAVVSKWDLDLWDRNDVDYDDITAYSLVWVYGVYDKELNVQRGIVNWYGKLGTARTDLMKKVSDGVFISITHQKVTLIKNGQLVAQGDCVTGFKGKFDTRIGAFSIENKARNATLSGDDYEVDVDFWMRFDGGIGLHDASWRTSFGGTIYLWNGSHGCPNLPHWLAETIYLNSYVGMSVYVAA